MSTRGRSVASLLAAALAGACAPQTDPADVARDVFTGAAAEWVDLTHAFDENTIFWPTAQPFELEVIFADSTEAGYYYAANNFSMAEHGGTHLDAPIHFAAGRQTADEIPLESLVGPAAVIDVREATVNDPDYQVQVADIEVYEAEHGRIAAGTIVLLQTGWDRYWPDREAYLGTALTGPEAVPQLHFPGLHPDAARWLVENRDVDAVGIDTPSIDYGQSQLYESHRILYEANIPGFENVAALDRLPPTGAYVVALPMKIGGGSGGPLRIVGVIPQLAASGAP